MTGPSTSSVLSEHKEHSIDLNALLLNINEYRKTTKHLGKPLTRKTTTVKLKLMRKKEGSSYKDNVGNRRKFKTISYN